VQQARTKTRRATGGDSGAQEKILLELARVEQALARSRWPAKAQLATACRAAPARAQDRPAPERWEEVDRWRIRVLFAGEILGELAGEIARRPQAARRLARALEEHASLARLDVAREAFEATRAVLPA